MQISTTEIVPVESSWQSRIYASRASKSTFLYLDVYIRNAL
jgi:hypothetical protein